MIRTSSYSFVMSVVAEPSSGGGVGGSSKTRKQQQGPAVALPLIVQSAMADDSQPLPDECGDGNEVEAWVLNANHRLNHKRQAASLMPPPPPPPVGPLASADAHREGKRASSRAAAAAPSSSAASLGSSRKRSHAFQASQTEYVAIPTKPQIQPVLAGSASRPKRQEGLCTYTNLDASQVPYGAGPCLHDCHFLRNI